MWKEGGSIAVLFYQKQVKSVHTGGDLHITKAPSSRVMIPQNLVQS